MLRRGFLKGMLGLAGLPVVARAAVQETRSILIQCSPVAGFQYHQGEEVWPLLRQGMTLTLRREPQNRYDRKAVAIDRNGAQLGYLPRAENHAVSAMLDSGQTLQARIVHLSDVDNPWHRIVIEVSIEV